MWLSERLTNARWISIFVALLGLMLLLSDNGSAQSTLNVSDLFSFLSGIFWAIGIASLNRWSSIPILSLSTFVFLSTTIISAMFAVLLYGHPLPSLAIAKAAFPTAAFWSIVVLLPCFLVFFRASQFLFPGRVALLTMSEVVFAIVSATILVPNEPMQTIQWLGAVAILLAGLIEVSFGTSQSVAGPQD
jgi:drug/metabolite transporter (DMT)-like permease